MKKILVCLFLISISLNTFSNDLTVYPTYQELNEKYNSSLFSVFKKTKKQKKELSLAKERLRISCSPKYEKAVNSRIIKTIVNSTVATGFGFVVQASVVGSMTSLVINQSSRYLYRNFAIASLSGLAGSYFGMQSVGDLKNGFALNKSEKLLKSAYTVLRCEKNKKGLRRASNAQYSAASGNNYCQNERAKMLIKSIANEIGDVTGRYYSSTEVAQVIYNGDLSGKYCQSLDIVNGSSKREISFLSYDDIKNYVKAVLINRKP
tara:strand:+ start:72829 stop:73617 length:789 start_codon:yes stop_codon:yes gene_type:complete